MKTSRQGAEKGWVEIKLPRGNIRAKEALMDPSKIAVEAGHGDKTWRMEGRNLIPYQVWRVFHLTNPQGKSQISGLWGIQWPWLELDRGENPCHIEEVLQSGLRKVLQRPTWSVLLLLQRYWNLTQLGTGRAELGHHDIGILKTSLPLLPCLPSWNEWASVRAKVKFKALITVFKRPRKQKCL